MSFTATVDEVVEDTPRISKGRVTAARRQMGRARGATGAFVKRQCDHVVTAGKKTKNVWSRQSNFVKVPVYMVLLFVALYAYVQFIVWLYMVNVFAYVAFQMMIYFVAVYWAVMALARLF